MNIRLLQDILAMNVAEHPDKVALICEAQRLTYSQMDSMSNRLANALTSIRTTVYDRENIFPDLYSPLSGNEQ